MLAGSLSLKISHHLENLEQLREIESIEKNVHEQTANYYHWIVISSDFVIKPLHLSLA